MSCTPPLTTRQFADAVGVVPETVRRWVRKGHITPLGRTPTGQLRFGPHQVEEALGHDFQLTKRAEDLGIRVNASLSNLERRRPNLRRAK